MKCWWKQDKYKRETNNYNLSILREVLFPKFFSNTEFHRSSNINFFNGERMSLCLNIIVPCTIFLEQNG